MEQRAADASAAFDGSDLLALLEGSPEGAIIIDSDTGLILWVNQSLARAYGGLPEELVSMPATVLLPGLEDLRRQAGPSAGSAMGHGLTALFQDRSGKTHLTECLETRVERHDGDALTLLQLRDVSGEMGAAKREERLRRLLADSFGATMIVSPDGIVRYVAPSIQNILGYSEQEFCGVNIRKLHHPDERRRIRAFVRTMPRDDSRLKRLVSRIRHADGAYRHIEATLRNLTMHPDVGGILVNFRDVTERVEAELEARKRREEVHVLARYRTMAELGSAIAHELNQPVAAIRNYAAGCLRTLDSADGLERSRWALEQIATEAERATRIMRSVHNFTTHKRIKRRVLPIRDVLEDISAFLMLKTQENNATLHVDVKADLHAWCDKTLIGQVILNLALNGLEAMHGTPMAERELTIAARNASNYMVEIIVSDRGAGMSAEQLQSLFLERVTTKERGFGLGLMLSRSVVTNHGGDMWAESESGKGTSFHLTLPRRSQKGAGLMLDHHASSGPSPRG